MPRKERASDPFGLISAESLTGIFIQQNGIVKHSNRRLMEMLGYAAGRIEEFAGRPVLDFVHPLDRDMVRERMTARLGGGKPPNRYELRLLTAGGGTLWVEILASVVDYDGQTAIMAHLVDVTERRRAIELLRLQYALSNALTGADDLDAALNLTLDALMQVEGVDGGAIYLADPTTGGLEMRVHRGLFGAFAAEVASYGPNDPQTLVVKDGKPVYGDYQQVAEERGFAPKPGAPKALAVIPVTYGSEVVAAVNLASHTADAIPQLAREALEAMSSRLGAVIVRARAEAALRESEARFRALSEASFGGVGIHDGKRIIDCNEGLVRLTGYDRGELIGMNPLDLMAPESRETARRTVVSGSPDPWEAVILRKDGTCFVAEMQGRSIPYQGRQVRVAEMHDITARRAMEAEKAKLEEQLLQSQKMEAVGRLAGGVAHDFNNILTTVLVSAEILASGLPESDPMHADLEGIRHAAERAAKLTTQLLAFSRKQIIAPRVIDLNAAVSQSTAMLGRLIGEDVALLFEPAADLGRIKADPGQIEQALVSLVVNARDAMPGGGRLVIETANVALDAEYCRIRPDARVGEWVMLGVSDTGPGLDEETRAHLFEPFFSTKHDSRSAGLGLATVYGAVKQNDGFINVYSELGVGTTFKLHFPRVEGTAQPAPRPPARGLPRGNETILLVEDEEMVRELARRVLARQGYVVLSAPCGEDAIGLWRERQSEIALLLTDVIMPRMNGRQLYERLRAERPELRVLYMSGYTENVIAHHGVLDEGARFLPKPFTIEVLARGVREALDE